MRIFVWNNNFNSDLFLQRFEGFIRALAIPGGRYKQSDNVQGSR